MEHLQNHSHSARLVKRNTFQRSHGCLLARCEAYRVALVGFLHLRPCLQATSACVILHFCCLFPSA